MTHYYYRYHFSLSPANSYGCSAIVGCGLLNPALAGDVGPSNSLIIESLALVPVKPETVDCRSDPFTTLKAPSPPVGPQPLYTPTIGVPSISGEVSAMFGEPMSLALYM